MAKAWPMQIRGPAPKGMYWNRWCFARAAGEKFSGSNRSGSFQSVSWRCSSQG
jgi:hypothetical protein